MGVVIRSSARDRESQLFIELQRGPVRAADLQYRAPCPLASGIREHVAEKRAREPLPAVVAPHGQAVDVQLVEDQPTGTERRDGRLGGARDVNARDLGI